MKKLYAPWRSSYAQKIESGKPTKDTAKNCVFCKKFAAKNDAHHFILRRFKYNAVLLNLYPYNAGHLLIIPFVHKANLFDISKQARTELIELTNQSIIILNDVLNAHGNNVGINIGKTAGAGIPSHLHVHVLPRYHGDTNFLPTLVETKQISFDLHAIYKKLKPAFTAV